MGCDIHLFAEKKVFANLEDKKNYKWLSLDKWTQNEDFLTGDSDLDLRVDYNDYYYTRGRNYNLFTALANVRSWYFNEAPPYIADPKGLPDDVNILLKKVSDSWDSDGHSHSYLTLKELKEFDWSSYGDTCKDFIDEVLPKMELHLGRYDKLTEEDIRIVFFFDN